MSKKMPKSRKYPLLNDKGWLKKKYIEERLSCKAIAEILGAGDVSVHEALVRLKIPRRSSGVGRIRQKELLDRAWLEQKYIKEKLNITEISELVGCGRHAVDNALKRLSVPRRCLTEARTQFQKLLDKRWLERKYVDDHLSCAKIGSILGCSASAVQEALKRVGIDQRHQITSLDMYPGLSDNVLLTQMYVDEKKSGLEIGRHIGCCTSLVFKALRAQEIPINPRSKALKDDCKYKELNDKEWVNQKYWVEKFSCIKIANEIGCDRRTVSRALLKCKVPTRTPLEVLIENHKNWKPALCRTKIEVELERIFNKYTDCIKYIGDGSFWVCTPEANINPDFIVKGKKIAIEANGDFWHSPLLNQNIKKGSVVTYRKRYLKGVGWQLIVFWETDINRDDAEQFVLHVLRKGGIV